MNDEDAGAVARRVTVMGRPNLSEEWHECNWYCRPGAHCSASCIPAAHGLRLDGLRPYTHLSGGGRVLDLLEIAVAGVTVHGRLCDRVRPCTSVLVWWREVKQEDGSA